MESIDHKFKCLSKFSLSKEEFDDRCQRLANAWKKHTLKTDDLKRAVKAIELAFKKEKT